MLRRLPTIGLRVYLSSSFGVWVILKRLLTIGLRVYFRSSFGVWVVVGVRLMLEVLLTMSDLRGYLSSSFRVRLKCLRVCRPLNLLIRGGTFPGGRWLVGPAPGSGGLIGSRPVSRSRRLIGLAPGSGGLIGSRPVPRSRRLIGERPVLRRGLILC